MKKDWFKKSYRRTLLDMHIEDWDKEFLSRYDPLEYIKTVKKAEVSSVMLYANSHVGCCYWPTIIGHEHRNTKNKNILGTAIEAAHREGLDVIVYYSLFFNNREYELHPEWRMKNIDGRYLREINWAPRFGVCCPNSPGYKEFVKTQLEEICKAYDFEGFFFDMPYWPVICYCDSCKKRFKDETGRDLPVMIDWNDEVWISFSEKRYEWLADFLGFTYSIIKGYDTGISIEHNAAVYPRNFVSGASSMMIKHSDYIGGDLYGGFTEQSFICKLYRSLTPEMPFEYMTSRCHPSLTEHTNIKPKEMLKLHNFISLAHGGAFLFIDAVDPAGTVNKDVYNIMEDIFIESKEYEKYTGGKLCADAGIYFSFRTKHGRNEPVRRADETVVFKNKHLEAALGAASNLINAHIPFDIFSEVTISDISKYNFIIINDILYLSDIELEVIKNYVNNGGGLYVSGDSDPSLLKEVFGISVKGKTKESYTYMVSAQESEDQLKYLSKVAPLGINGPQIIVETEDRNGIIADILLPYTDPSDNTIFASIHSNPPGSKRVSPAIIKKKYGSGTAVWVSAEIEKYSNDEHRTCFIELTKMLSDKPLYYEAQGPGEVEVLRFDQPEENCSMFFIINEQVKFPLYPVYDFVIKINTNGKKPLRAVLKPDNKEMEMIAEDDSVMIKLPKLEIMKLLCLEYDERG